MEFLKFVTAILATLSAVEAGQFISSSPARKADVVPDTYIVVMKNGTSAHAFDEHRAWVSKIHEKGGQINGKQYRGMKKDTFHIGNLMGYSGIFAPEVVSEIVKSEDVEYVQPSHRLRLPKSTSSNRDVEKFAVLSEEFKRPGWAAQSPSPSWALRRISHRQRGGRDYIYHETAGKNITIYVVDSGVDVTHSEFDGRAKWGANLLGDGIDYDDDGHGTEIAGILIGKTWGVAKKATVIGIRAFNWGKSATDEQLAGGLPDPGPQEDITLVALTWVVRHATQHQKLGKAAMVLSFGEPRNKVLDQAVEEAASAGIFVVIAAGNDGTQTADDSPQTKAACMVGASAQNDTRWIHSHFGPIIDVYAPGHDVPTAKVNGSLTVVSGTSFAAPYVAGVGACLMAAENIPPHMVCDRIKQLAQPSIIDAPKNGTNKLLYNGSGA
ncbi:hypothetical protein PRK78_004096 [Emydomyces testavorans]|uniref:Uncharacterized protein n=1 Tax=Emydomyces testavorans TaxID=2070801 RepID=A0AAF0DI42_9EURO|nr:hypothetical protein PRK78_004096 [Emydomyces testavorans]